MEKIYNIINSELIVRTNNIKLRQEFGEVGTHANISTEGTSTIFTTAFTIKKINYITVNGINLIEGVHYEQDASNRIKISNAGAPVRKNPSLTTTILVSYYAGPSKSVVIKVPPTINFFTLSTYSGQNAEILFDFEISAFDGKNIYWSILKDGSSVPLYSGNTLKTVDGHSIKQGVDTKLNHFITEPEYLSRQGEDVPFTLIVVYDLTDDATSLDEKLLASAKYHIESTADVTGHITVSPEMISTAGLTHNVSAAYNINNVAGTPVNFDWIITRSISGGAETTVRYGNQVSPNLADTYSETVVTVAGQNNDIRFYLKVKETGSADYRTLSTDKVIIAVPQASLVAHAGYLDAAIMSYIDSSDNVRKKIGSLGTAQDLVEYNNRVPSEIFTKDVTIGYLTSNEFVNAFVNTFGDIVSTVYFVIELPDNWGPVDFYQTLGLVNQSAFNKISLGNGYTAYLYKDAPSTVANPSDYYLKARA